MIKYMIIMTIISSFISTLRILTNSQLVIPHMNALKFRLLELLLESLITIIIFYFTNSLPNSNLPNTSKIIFFINTLIGSLFYFINLEIYKRSTNIALLNIIGSISFIIFNKLLDKCMNQQPITSGTILSIIWLLLGVYFLNKN